MPRASDLEPINIKDSIFDCINRNMSATSCAISTEPDTRTPAQIANDKAWVGSHLDREANDLLDQLEYYLEQEMQICLNRLMNHTRDSRHYQRVQQVLRQVQFVESAMTDVVHTHQSMMEAHAAWDTCKFPPPATVRTKAPRKALNVSGARSKKQKK